MREVFGEGEEVVVAFAFAPSGVVGGNEENVFEFEAFGLVSAEDIDGVVGFVIGAGASNGHFGGSVIIDHGEKIGEFHAGIGVVIVSGGFGTEDAKFVE